MGFTVPERVEAMNKTTIEYLDYTWNPLAMRCTPVSEGCRDCWHIQRANMLAKNPLIPEHIQKAYAGGLPVLIESRLEEPLKVKKPSIIGVQFMGDLFHESLTVEEISKIFTIMIRSPQLEVAYQKGGMPTMLPWTGKGEKE